MLDLTLEVITKSIFIYEKYVEVQMASENIVEVTDANFEEEVKNSAVPILVDFWAPWCGPCLRMAPMLEEIAAKYQGKLKVVKVNVDESQQTAIAFGIQSIPTLLIFKNGEVAERILGLMPPNVLEEKINSVLEE